MPVQKGFPYLHALNHQLSLMKESGVLNKLRDEWLHAREYTMEFVCQSQNVDTSGYETVEWRNVIDLFWLLLAGIFSCCVVLLLEKLLSMLSQNFSYK